MSQRNKLSLWQKIKRFLTTSAPQSVIDGANEPTTSAVKEDVAHSKSYEVFRSTRHSDDGDKNDRSEIDAVSDMGTSHKHSQTMPSDSSADQHKPPIHRLLIS